MKNNFPKTNAVTVDRLLAAGVTMQQQISARTQENLAWLRSAIAPDSPAQLLDVMALSHIDYSCAIRALQGYLGPPQVDARVRLDALSFFRGGVLPSLS